MIYIQNCFSYSCVVLSTEPKVAVYSQSELSSIHRCVLPHWQCCSFTFFFSKNLLSPSHDIIIESRSIFVNTCWQSINKILLKFQTNYHIRTTVENSANCLAHILWASSTGRRLQSVNVFPHPFHLHSLKTFRSKLLQLQAHVEHG